jgi:hypothetical protein
VGDVFHLLDQALSSLSIKSSSSAQVS